jgi:hypothetical protein
MTGGDGYALTMGPLGMTADTRPELPAGQLRSAFRNQNGMPELARYRHAAADDAREREVARLVALAQARADAMPGAIPRCTDCGKPAAECAEIRCGRAPS